MKLNKSSEKDKQDFPEGSIISHKYLVFLHNNRCAGNTVNESVFDYITEIGGALKANGKSFFKIGKSGEIRNTWEDFLAAAKQGEAVLYSGHLPFGCGSWIGEGTHYACNLREPTGRSASLLAFDQPDPGELDAWFAREWEPHNGMTKRLAGYHVVNGMACDGATGREICPAGEFVIDDAVFTQALENLENQIDVIIPQNRFTEGAALFEFTFGLPPLFSFTKVHYNQRPSVDYGAEGKRVLAELDEENEYDRALYARGMERFEEMYRPVEAFLAPYVRAREAIHDMLFVKGKGALTAEEVSSCINSGINAILRSGDAELALNVFELFIGHPNSEPAFRKSMAETAVQLFGIGVKDRVDGLVNEPFSFPDGKRRQFGHVK